jgi:pSer/pThr/pTyr-binding forkhead associated (FHA) protein
VIQLQILSGKLAGRDIVVRHFPLVVGRAASADVRLEDAGVWERHLQIAFKRGEGFEFSSQESALTLVNSDKVSGGLLRNGDLIEIGGVQLRFWLARSEQRSLRLREVLTWTSLFVLPGVQLALIYWLLR